MRSVRGLVPSLPAFTWLCLFFLLPGALVAVFSLGESTFFGTNPVDLSALSLHRYGEATSDTFRIVFQNTLQLSVVGTALCVLLAVPMAYLIATRLTGFWKYAAIAAVVIPYWMPFLLRTYSWRILLGDHGPITGALGVDSLGVLDTLAGAQLGVVYNYLPLAVLPIAVALDRLDPALRKAGRDLGASPWRVFWQVTLPAVRPGVISAALLVFIPLMGDYVTPSILGGVKAAVAGQLVSSSFLESQDWALGAATAVLLIGLVLVVLGCAALLLRLVSSLLRVVRPLDLTARFASTGWGHDFWGPGLRVFGIALTAFLWLPILTIVIYSFNGGRTLPVWSGFSTRWYAAVPDNHALVSSIGISLQVALLSTLVAVIVGTLAGAALARAARPLRRTLLGLLLIVFITPEIVSAIGLLLLYVAAGPGLSNGVLRLVIAHSVIAVAIVAFVVQARLSSLDPRLSDAAADLGAPPHAVFRRITVPLAVPAVLAAAVLASTASLDDVVASSMLGNVGTTTLPVFVYSTVRNGLRGDAAAASVGVMLLIAVAVVAIGWVLRLRGQSKSFAEGLVGQ
ncbi:ABC transporter permease subunit [Kribbella antibiotica]|uniref:ABC transporter permease subunit n=1 Tax=Kribbella antibiotica TaxID=190195 RepID=A0A4V2YQS9_9ACTN|nr:ABC transporter permease subunit [Kribbella antibiotica]TDD63297.1 ABC transporter permease subunit [Kribbella antibiotica]